MYRMTIQPGCVSCGRCSHILPGWPEQYEKNGLLVSSRHLEKNSVDIERMIAACPLDLIELNEVTP